MHKFSRKHRTIKMVRVIKFWRVFFVSHGQRTCFNAGITGMTCRDVAETSLSDLAGLAQYCSSRARLQLLKQHSSTIPRFWGRRLFDLLVGRPVGKQMKIMSLWTTWRETLVTRQTKLLKKQLKWIVHPKISSCHYKPVFQTIFLSMQWKSVWPQWLLLYGQKQFFFCVPESHTGLEGHEGD